jgi:GNAT superfamily N-acetyltransferase
VGRATAADVAPLTELLALLFAQEADFAPDADRQTAGLRLILEQPESGHIDCAVTADGIIGMVSILFTVSTAEGGRVAWLEDLIVHPEWRAIGVGDRLLREAIRGAKLADCKRLTLLTDESNTVAMRGYARVGFVRSRMVPMRLMLCRTR